LQTKTISIDFSVKYFYNTKAIFKDYPIHTKGLTFCKQDIIKGILKLK